MKQIILLFSLVTSFTIYSQDSFFMEDESIEESIHSYSGKIEAGTTYFDDTYFFTSKGGFDSELSLGAFDVISSFNLEVNSLDSLDQFPLQGEKAPAEFFIDTLYLRYYHDYFDVELGLMKPVWGNADGIHAVDFLDPLDYRDPFDPSYLERKVSQEMVKVNIPFGDSSLVEAVYKPRFQGDIVATSGRWAPYYLTSLGETLFSVMYPIALAQNPLTPPQVIEAEAIGLVSNMEVQEAKWFVDSEVALRYTQTLGNLDLGLTYYWGHLNTPTMNPDDVLKKGKIELYYNRVHSFGGDIAAQVWDLNLKGEASYNLTDDIEGDDPGILNSSFKYIAGFDYNLPVSSVNILLQGVGEITMNSNKIEEVDTQYRDDYTNFMIMGRISDNYLYETLFIEFAASYDPVFSDYVLMPQLEYKINDDLSVKVKYLLFEGESDTDFGQFNDNDTLKLTVEALL